VGRGIFLLFGGAMVNVAPPLALRDDSNHTSARQPEIKPKIACIR
jgi:hypothetical protein